MGNIVLSPMDRLARVLADCTTWQTLCAPDDPFDHIHMPYSEQTDPYPRITLDIPENLSMQEFATATWLNNSGLIMTLEVEAPTNSHSVDDFSWVATGSQKSEATWFYEQLGLLIEDMRALASGSGANAAASSTHLAIRGFKLLAGPWIVPVEERDAPTTYAGTPLTLWFAVLGISYEGQGA